jgi:LysR family transcriptional regulator, flagellar master operon regulator
MCADLLTGILDFAVMFSPKPHPDLHFESVGDVTYRMVSTDTARLAEITPDRFVFAHFSPAFEEMHRQQTPDLATSPVSVGQSGSVVSLLTAMGGSGYVLEKTAAELVTGGRFMAVADAPDLRQPVFAAIHIRHRMLPLHRKLTQLVRRHFG